MDCANNGALISQLTEGVDKIEAGIGEKLGLFVQHLSVFIGDLVMSFVYNWELTLVSVTCLPIVCIAFAAVGIVARNLSAQEGYAYSQASGIAGEVLSAVKTVFAFEGQTREVKRYSRELVEAERIGLKRAVIISCSKPAYSNSADYLT